MVLAAKAGLSSKFNKILDLLTRFSTSQRTVSKECIRLKERSSHSIDFTARASTRHVHCNPKTKLSCLPRLTELTINLWLPTELSIDFPLLAGWLSIHFWAPFPYLWTTTSLTINKFWSFRLLLKMSSTLRPHGLYSPRNSPGQNTWVGSLSLLQGIFPTQGLNPGLPHCGWILYQLSH